MWFQYLILLFCFSLESRCPFALLSCAHRLPQKSLFRPFFGKQNCQHNQHFSPWDGLTFFFFIFIWFSYKFLVFSFQDWRTKYHVLLGTESVNINKLWKSTLEYHYWLKNEFNSIKIFYNFSQIVLSFCFYVSKSLPDCGRALSSPGF